MKRDELALQIFLRRMPHESLNTTNAAYFRSKVDEAYELARVFVDRAKELGQLRPDIFFPTADGADK